MDWILLRTLVQLEHLAVLINWKLKEKIARRMETMMKRGGDHEKVWKLRMRGEDREEEMTSREKLMR